MHLVFYQYIYLTFSRAILGLYGAILGLLLSGFLLLLITLFPCVIYLNRIPYTTSYLRGMAELYTVAKTVENCIRIYFVV